MGFQSFAGRKPFQDFEREFLRITILNQVILKFPIQFKGFGRALRPAIQRGAGSEIPSTKGVL